MRLPAFLPPLFGLIALLLAAGQAQAWNATGHRLVAALAWEQMPPAARAGASRLLDAHPDSRRWLARGDSGDAGRALFIESSTWADEIRDDPRFYDETREAPKAAIPGLIDQARHRHWHYLDLPASGHERPGKGELDQQLERLLGVLHHGSEAERIHALPWIIHLLADLHQPLHVGSRDGDGGNRFQINDPEHPRRREGNLHRWWDDLPGPPWVRGDRLQAAVAVLAAGQTRPVQGNVALWREESRQLAHRFAYPAANGNVPVTLDPDFSARAREISRQRLYAAGVRLGRLLAKLLAVPRETSAP